MSAITNIVSKFARDEQGATAIEYGLLAAGVGVAIMGVVFTLGGDLSGMFSSVSTRLSTPAGN